MVVGLDRDEHGDVQAELLGIEQSDPPLDDAFGLEPLDALPARGLRQADAVADLGDREGRVLLQERQDVPVSGIHL